MTDKQKLEKIKVLADAMYNRMQNLTTDTSGIRKAMYDYHQFIINEYYKEEPVSKDLEEAATKYAQDKHLPVQTWQAFKAGAQWQKDHTCFTERTKTIEEIKEALLSEVLPFFMRGGEADEVVAKLDEVLNKRENKL